MKRNAFNIVTKYKSSSVVSKMIIESKTMHNAIPRRPYSGVGSSPNINSQMQSSWLGLRGF